MVLIVGTKSIITYTSEPDQFKCYNFDGLVKNLSINLPQLTEASGINSKPGNDDGDDANDDDVNVNGPESFDDTKCKTLQQTGHNSGQSKLPLIVRKIVCGQLSPSEKYLALCDNLKQLFVVTTDDWKVCNVFNVERKCDHLLFNQSEDQLIVTNRSGWVYGYFLDANNKNRENFLLGHNSIVLDIKLSPCSKYLATCDRDEKIRISNYPNCYNIQSYCLGHTQFVSCLTFLDDSTLISGGGDGTLRVWDYQNGKQLAVHHCNQELNCENDKLAPRAIHSFSNHKLLIVVTFYNSPNIEIYQITDGSIKNLKKQSILSLEADIIDSYVINGCQLICFTNNSERFVVSFNLSSSEAVLNGDDSVTLIENLSPLMSSILNDKELIKNFISEKLTVNSIGWLYKHVYDNVNEYLERKKERQENKMTKKIKSS